MLFACAACRPRFHRRNWIDADGATRQLAPEDVRSSRWLRRRSRHNAADKMARHRQEPRVEHRDDPAQSASWMGTRLPIGKGRSVHGTHGGEAISNDRILSSGMARQRHQYVGVPAQFSPSASSRSTLRALTSSRDECTPSSRQGKGLWATRRPVAHHDRRAAARDACARRSEMPDPESQPKDEAITAPRATGKWCSVSWSRVEADHQHLRADLDAAPGARVFRREGAKRRCFGQGAPVDLDGGHVGRAGPVQPLPPQGRAVAI